MAQAQDRTSPPVVEPMVWGRHSLGRGMDMQCCPISVYTVRLVKSIRKLEL